MWPGIGILVRLYERTKMYVDTGGICDKNKNKSFAITVHIYYIALSLIYTHQLR